MTYVIVTIVCIVDILINYINFLLIKRYTSFALIYPQIIAISGFTCCIEFMIYDNFSLKAIGFTAVGVAVLAQFSAVTYCKKVLLYCYLASSLYLSFRIYKHFDDLTQFLNLILGFYVAITFIYLLSRQQMHRERLIFRQKHNSKEVLKLFYGLAKSFHDGIAIMRNEDIIFNN